MSKSALLSAAVGAVVLGPLVMLWALDSRAARKVGGPEDEAVSDPAEIHRPSAWVAFGADVEITDDRDTRVIKGKFYQDRNGSSYTETGPNPPGSPVSDDPDRPNNVITIHNIPHATSYIRGTRGVWEKHPLGVEPKQWQPKRYRYNEHVKDHAERVLGWKVEGRQREGHRLPVDGARPQLRPTRLAANDRYSEATEHPGRRPGPDAVLAASGGRSEHARLP